VRVKKADKGDRGKEVGGGKEDGEEVHVGLRAHFLRSREDECVGLFLEV
jgi:hypothetical protein